MTQMSRNRAGHPRFFPAMKQMMTTALIAASLVTVTASQAEAKGCLRGAAVGGVAGHYVSRGHAVAGAAVGCIAAHHHYAKQARQQRESARHHG